MNLAISNIVRNSNRSWTFSWTPASPAPAFYRVVLFGKELARPASPSYVYAGQEYGNFPPPLEVVAGLDPALSETFNPYLIMQWYGEPSTSFYEIRQFNPANNSYTMIRQIQESGLWIYTFQTVVLMDEINYAYEVFAVNSINTYNTPRNYNRYVVTPPQPPDGKTKLVYAGGTLTINPA